MEVVNKRIKRKQKKEKNIRLGREMGKFSSSNMKSNLLIAFYTIENKN